MVEVSEHISSRQRQDEFPKPVRDMVARRAAYLCSNPQCPSPRTIGPTEEPTGSITLGDACHIKAKASGGPRYDPSQSSEERKSLSNAIWLCKKCATLIDRDVTAYPVELLYEWRRAHEQKCKEALTSADAGLQKLQAAALPEYLEEVRKVVREELQTYNIQVVSDHEKRSTRRPISVSEAFRLYTDDVRGGAWIKAGRFLLSVLIQMYDSDENFGDANVLWFFAIDAAMPLSLRLVIRSYQIGLRHRYNLDYSSHIQDLNVQLESMDESHAWAIPACLLIGSPSAVQSLAVLHNVLPFLDDRSIWRPVSETSDSFLPEVLTLLHADRISSFHEFEEWLNAFAKLPEDLIDKTNASAIFRITMLWLIDRLWLREYDKSNSKDAWEHICDFLDVSAKMMSILNAHAISAAIAHALIIIQADFLENLSAAEDSAERFLSVLEVDSEGSFLVAESICRQYLYANDDQNVARWYSIARSHPTSVYEEQFVKLLVSIAGRTEVTRQEALGLISEAEAVSSISIYLKESAKIKITGELSSALWLTGQKTDALHVLYLGFQRALQLEDRGDEEKDCIVAFLQVINAFTAQELTKDIIPSGNRLIGHFVKYDGSRIDLYNEALIFYTKWQFGTILTLLGNENDGIALLKDASDSVTPIGNVAAYLLAMSVAAISMADGDVVRAILYSEKMKEASRVLDPNVLPGAVPENLDEMRKACEDGARGILFIFWILSLFRISVKNPSAIPVFFESTIHKLYSSLDRDEIQCANYAALKLLGKEMFPSSVSEQPSRKCAEIFMAIDFFTSILDPAKSLLHRYNALIWFAQWTEFNLGGQALPAGYLMELPVLEYWRREVLERGFSFPSVRLLREEFGKIDELPHHLKIKFLLRALALSFGNPIADHLVKWLWEDTNPHHTTESN